MLVCHCKVVSDRHIKLAVSAGARTVGQVGKACHAGTRCGGCVAAIAEIIEAHAEPSGDFGPCAMDCPPVAAE